MIWLRFRLLLRLEPRVGPDGRVDAVNDLGVADHGVPGRKLPIADGASVGLDLQVFADHVLPSGVGRAEHGVAVVALQVLDLVVHHLDVMQHGLTEVELPVADFALVFAFALE